MGNLFAKKTVLIDYTIPINDPVQNKSILIFSLLIFRFISFICCFTNTKLEFPTNEVSTTKYTVWNFAFKNLFEQFRRYQNFYFALVCIPTFVPGLAPISPASAIIPFLLILAVAAVKEAYEDFVCDS